MTTTMGRPAEKCHEMGGQFFSLTELAALAQCGLQTMARRLSRHPAARAVAMGKPDKNRLRGSREHFNTPTGMHPATKFYAVGDEVLTLRQLAQRAGCSDTTMISRLRRNSPTAAVGMGRPNPNRPRKIAPPKVRAEPPPKPVKVVAPKPKKPAMVKPASSQTLSASSRKWQEHKADKRSVELGGPAIILPGAKITRAATPVDRFAVDPASVPRTFGRIGEYAETGSPLERAYGGGAC